MFTKIYIERGHDNVNMFTTNEAREFVPEAVRSALWIALDNMSNPAFNQRFELTALQVNGKPYQHIVHTQKDSTYREEYKFELQQPVANTTLQNKI